MKAPIRFNSWQNVLPDEVKDYDGFSMSGTGFKFFDGNTSAAQVFGAVLDKDDYHALENGGFVGNPANFIQAIQELPPDFDPTVVNMTHFNRVDTCSSSIMAALNVNGGFGDYVRVQAAFDAEKTEKRSLIVFLGRFWSPISIALAHPNEPKSVAMRLRIWDYYATKQAPLDSKFYYVPGFRGAITYAGEQDSSSIRVSAQQTSNVSISDLVHSDSKSGTSVSSGHQTRAEYMSAYAYAGSDTKWKPDIGENGSLSPLPSPNDIMGWFSHLSPSPILEEDYLIQGHNFGVRVPLEGFPPDVCRDANFAFYGDHKGYSFAEDKIMKADPCTLRVYFLPPADAFDIGPGKNLQIPYQFKFSLQYGPAVQGRNIVFDVSTDAPRQRNLYFGVPQALYSPDSASLETNTIWKVGLIMVDTQDVVINKEDQTSATIVRDGMGCGQELTGLSEPEVSFGGAGLMLRLALAPPPGAKFAIDGKNGHPCSVSYRISVNTRKIQDAKGKTVAPPGTYVQQVPLRLFVPSLAKEAPPVAVTGDAGVPARATP